MGGKAVTEGMREDPGTGGGGGEGEAGVVMGGVGGWSMGDLS